MRGEAGGGAVALAAAGRAVEDLGRLHGPLVPGRGAGDKGRVTLPGLLSRLGDLALPPRCPGCGATVSAQGFCLDCWSALRLATQAAVVRGVPIAVRA
ncbi:double zinc ribbon domain-containing protein [Sphingomonas sp. MMS24-JH45]